MPTETHDLVIVGAGLAGLTAALAAAQAGLRPLLLEKSGLIGGATSWSYGALWVSCSAQAAAAGITDQIDDAARYLDYLGAGENTPSRTNALLAHAPRVLALLEAAGVNFSLIDGVGDILHGIAPGAAAGGRTLEPEATMGAQLGAQRTALRIPPGDPLWRLQRSVAAKASDPADLAEAVAAAITADQLAQGPSLIARLLLALRPYRVDLRLEQAASSLIREDGRVTGVRSQSGRLLYGRLGVLLAAGGYLANSALVAALDKLADYQPYFPQSSGGDSLVLAAEAGGSIRSTRNNLVIMLGFDDPDQTALQAGAPSTRDLPRAHTMVVNRAGERFGNEANFQLFSPQLRAMDWTTRQLRNLPCWMITDQAYVARWGLGQGPGTVPGFVVSAATIRALAEAAGIHPPGLAATVDRFNAYAGSGHDAEFDRKPGWAMTPGFGQGRNASLGAIAAPPFHAARLRPTLGAAGSGVAADAFARVLDWRDQPIPGLYCAGDAALHDEFGAGYQAGMTYTAAITFAWLAVEHMTARPPPA